MRLSCPKTCWGGGAVYVPTHMARREVLFTPVDSLFGQYRVRQLMSTWPFEPPDIPMDPLDSLQARTSVEGIALALFRGEIQWFEATDRLRAHYEQLSDYTVPYRPVWP